MKRIVQRIDFREKEVAIIYKQEGDSEVLARAIIIEAQLVRPLTTRLFQAVLDKLMDEERLKEFTAQDVEEIINQLLKSGEK